MINKDADYKGFMVFKDCGAVMPRDDIKVLKDIGRPYKSKYARTNVVILLQRTLIWDMIL